MVPALYVHIPFCSHICPFCSFAVRPDRFRSHRSYFAFVKREFRLLQDRSGLDLTRVRSVYFGGGTPSRLSLEELREWIEWLNDTAGFHPRAQWSIEANPEDLTPAYAGGLAELGFNRVSIGVQSFQDDCLQLLQRRHSAGNARLAVTALLESGISDFNLDLMFGYPGQSRDSLLADLTEMIAWEPTHLSVYCLNIEERTPLFRKPAWQQWQNENEDQISDMYHLIVDCLAENGFRQYEVSNFARKGRQSRQNLLNWNGRDYLGLGMGAHSLVNGERWGNHKRWVDYKTALAGGVPPRQYREKLDRTQLRDERLMLGLRMNKGLNLSGFQGNFNLDLDSCWLTRLSELEEAGLLTRRGGRLRLTVSGMLLADTITAELAALLEEQENFSEQPLKV